VQHHQVAVLHTREQRTRERATVSGDIIAEDARHACAHVLF
jgi:hypothetical protein